MQDPVSSDIWSLPSYTEFLQGFSSNLATTLIHLRNSTLLPYDTNRAYPKRAY